MQFAPTAIAPALPTSTPPPAGPPPRAAEPGSDSQSAFAKVLASRQRDAKAVDTKQAQAAEARAQESRQGEQAPSAGGPEEAAAQATAGDEIETESTPTGAAEAQGPVPTATVLAEVLASLNRPLPPAEAEAAPADTPAIGTIAARPRGLPGTAAAAERASRASGLQADTTASEPIAPVAAEENFAAAVEAIAARTDEDPARTGIHGESPLAAPAPTAGLHAAPRSDGGVAPLAVAVATPATAPQFHEALGVQVSVLARDGVQHAELQLNPAEMGPISVQIALDGARAQVDFGADSFATRQIIEAGLPELAAALRDAGFTLSGGGVSEHSRGRGEAAERRTPEGSGMNREAAIPGSTVRATLRMPQGAVDLYA